MISKLRIGFLLSVTVSYKHVQMANNHMIYFARQITLFAVVIGQPQYRVKLQEPLAYRYSSGRTNQLSDGSCCNSDETAPCTLGCSGVTVELCFREEGHDPRDTDTTNCPLGRRVVPASGPGELFGPTGTIELEPTAAAITTGTAYPVSLVYLR